jgi:Fe-Mn family superoxide dismutase
MATQRNEECATLAPIEATLERRTFLTAAASAGLAAGLVTIAPHARGQAQGSALEISSEAFARAHEPKPLPFDAASLNGLSARLIESHWSNNYGGSVRALNDAKGRLADALAATDTPPFVYNGLKREHLMRTGSVVLHELYFDNLGGNGTADAAARAFIGSAFGDFARWETEFRRIAAGLGGGSGWVVLGYNRHFATLENYWLADHMHFAVGAEPLLVMDMYEHSYQMDFGAATARYIDAFFANIDWERVLARVDAIRA